MRLVGSIGHEDCSMRVSMHEDIPLNTNMPIRPTSVATPSSSHMLVIPEENAAVAKPLYVFVNEKTSKNRRDRRRRVVRT